MSTSLSSWVPNQDDLLALAVGEVAGVLLAHLNSYSDDSGNTVVQRGQISQHNFFNNLNHHPEYPGRQGLSRVPPRRVRHSGLSSVP